MVVKSSNICLSADVDNVSELLTLADTVGPSIVVLKTHYDIIKGWNHNRRTGTATQLAALARKHGFLLFEDRKFGDIGSTVQKQYVGGEAAIIEWAHITNVNMIPGPAAVEALSQAARSWRERKRYEVKTDITAGKRSDRTSRKRSKDSSALIESEEDEPLPASPKSLCSNVSRAGRKASIVSITTISQNFESANAQQIVDATAFPLMGEAPLERGLLILAQMSSAGNLMTPAYTEACVAAARAHKDFVMGFVSQESLNSEPDDDFITMTPGCQLPPSDEDAQEDDSNDDGEDIKMQGDGLGQQYNTPRKLVNLGCDIVIVGRGILKAEDPVSEAERYRKTAWKSYLDRVGGGKIEK